MKIASNSKKHEVITEFITKSPYLANLPPPYQITHNSKEKKPKCLININAMVVDDTRVIMAECIDIMDIVKDVIPNAMLIPSKYKHNIEDDEEMEVETITINDKTYYTNNKKHGNLFEISENDNVGNSIGNSIGNIINSTPYFF